MHLHFFPGKYLQNKKYHSVSITGSMNKKDRIADRRVSCMPGGEQASYALQMLESWCSGKKVKKEAGEAVNRSRSTKPLLSPTMLQIAILFYFPICSVTGSSGTRRCLAWPCSGFQHTFEKGVANGWLAGLATQNSAHCCFIHICSTGHLSILLTLFFDYFPSHWEAWRAKYNLPIT